MSATDDGVPAPRPHPARAAGQEPFVLNAPVKDPPRPLPGLSYIWMLYRGPAKVQFDSDSYTAIPSGTTVVTNARFSVPGTYVLRVRVSDSILETTRDVTVVVPEGSR